MNSQKINVRLASKSDATPISEILRRAFAYSFRNEVNALEVDAYIAGLSEVAISELMDCQGVTFLVIEMEGRIFGCAQITEEAPGELHSEDSWLKLERLYLDPERIGTGAGKLLMEAFFATAKKKKSAHIWLQVLRVNTRAVKFYEDFGFQTFRTSPGKFRADGEIDLWMRKELD